MTIDKAEANGTVCPYIGLERDSQSHYAMADGLNLCHRVHPPRPANFNYQERCCLTEQFPECRGYQQGWGKALPADLVYEYPRKKIAWGGWIKALLILLALAGMAVLTSFLFPGLEVSKILAVDPSPTHTLRARPAATQTPFSGALPLTPMPTETFLPTWTLAPLPTLAPTLLPSPTSLPSLTPGPLAETPMGQRIPCLVHLVGDGESLLFISTNFNTNLDVLSALNGSRVAPLWVGIHIVICPGQTDPASLPRMEPRFLAVRTRAADLAAETGVKLADLQEWNGLQGEWIEANRWVIIPQP